MRDLDFVRAQPVGVRHVGDGLAIPEISDAARRVRRFLLLQGAQDILQPFRVEKIDLETGEIKDRSEFRVSVCARNPVGGGEVRVYRNGPSLGYSGVMRCGNVWSCVVCCAKVMRKRGDQIAQLFERVHGSGGSAAMVTFTASHSLDDPLSGLLERFKAAQRYLSQSRQFRELVADRSGATVVTEIKWGARNGWHPHQHQAWFWDWMPGPAPEHLAAQLFPIWASACAKVGLTTAEFFRGQRVGVDVRRAWNAAEYLTKFDREREWSLAAEITAGRLKTGGNSESFTPWGVLEEAILRGKGSRAADLWVEYCRATKGKACVSMKAAKPLLDRFGMPTSFDDWQDANDAGAGEVIGSLSPRSFEIAVRAGGLGSLLEAARASGLGGLDRMLQSFSIEGEEK